MEFKQIIPKGFCLTCKGCCRFTKQDGIWLPQLLQEEKEKEIFCAKKINLFFHKEEGYFVCEFLNLKDSKCTIYEERPFECALYPFLINRRSTRCFLAVDMRCPFVEKHFNDEEFKHHIHYLAEFFKKQQSLRLLKDNPHLILPYEEVVNLFELDLGGIL